MAATSVLLVDSPKIHYNTSFQVLICEVCRACIDHTHAANHFQKYHKHMRKKARLQVLEEIDQQINARGLSPTTPDQASQPKPLEIYFEMLPLTPRNYFACKKSECSGCITANEGWIRQHYNEIHHIKFTGNSSIPYWSELEAQTLFIGPKRFFIPATEYNRRRMNANSASPSPNFTNIAETIGEPGVDSQMLIDNTIAEFLQSLDEAKKQTNETFGETNTKYLHQFIQNFRWQYWLKNQNVLALGQLANSPKPSDQCGQWITAMSTECWHATEHLLDTLDRSLLQVVNTDIFHKDQNSEYGMRPFKSLQEDNTKKRYSKRFSAWIYMTYQIWQKQIFANWSAPIIDLLKNIEQLGEECEWKIERVTNEQTLAYNRLIFKLVNAMISERITLTEFTEADLSPKFSNPLIIHCMAVSFDNTGAFRANSNIANVYGSLIYGVRLMAIGYVLMKNTDQKEAGRSFDLQASMQAYHGKWLNVNRFTPFGELQHMRAYMRKCEKHHMKEGCIEDVNEDTIRYDGEEIKISEFRKSLHHLISECEGLLYNQMLYIHPDELSEQVNVASLQDQTNEKSRGYSFRKHPSNQLDGYDLFLIKRFTNPNTELGQQFSERTGERRTLRPLRVNDWLRVRARFIRNFALLIHFSGGAPIRGSEILTILFQNSATLSRGVFIDKGLKKVIIKSRYTKMGSAIGQDSPTTRVLSTRISQMLVHYLIIGLPLYQYLMNQQFTANGEVYHISDVLFEMNAKPLPSDMIGRMLQRHCKLHLHNSLGILGWRHSAKYIIRTRIIRGTDLVLPSDSSSSDENGGAKLHWAEDRMSGHTSWSAQLVYARSIHLPNGMTENTFGNALALSQKWEDFLQLDQAPSVITRRTNSSTGKKHTRQKSSVTTLPKRIKAMQHAIDQSLQSNTPTTSESVSEALIGFFGSKRAKFRTNQQRQAVESVIDQEASVIYVSGTGSGKSLVYFLPSLIEQHKYHVVLAPLVALKGDLLARAEAAKLNTAIWEHSLEKNEKLMFVSFESIHQNIHWNQWINRNRYAIARIYIDEAHVIITQSKWRYIMRYISELNQLKLPITFLTATFTAELQVLLFNEMKLSSNTRLIRGSVKRPNIHYEVHLTKANEISDIHYKEIIMAYVTSLIANKAVNGEDRILIFRSGSYRAVESLASELKCEYYHATRPDGEDILARFKKDDLQALVATSALGLGLDISNIRLVIHVGFLLSVIDFSQESGRAGRDGEKAFSLVITSDHQSRAEATKRIPYEASELDFDLFTKIDKVNMNRFIYSSRCRRIVLNEVFDLMANKQCDASEGDESCDLCANRARTISETAQREAEHQAVLVDNTSKLVDLLDQLKNTCIWCVLTKNYDYMIGHSFSECKFRQFNTASVKCSYAYLGNWINNIKEDIQSKRAIREGHGCYSCFLPMNQCSAPHGPSANIGGSGSECEWANVVVEFNVLIYWLHRHDRCNHSGLLETKGWGQIAKALVKPVLLHNTESIQGVDWLWEFNWNQWIRGETGVSLSGELVNEPSANEEEADEEEANEEESSGSEFSLAG